MMDFLVLLLSFSLWLSFCKPYYWSNSVRTLDCKLIMITFAIPSVRARKSRVFGKNKSPTKSIEEIAFDYEDDKNSMISIVEKENYEMYDDFYEELDSRIRTEQSMNMIFFGPPGSFMRLDPESILHIFTSTKQHLIPITRTLLAWDMITDGKTAAFLQGREYLAFTSLINVVPEEDLYHVNFGDPSILNFFGNTFLHMNHRKFGILAAAYRRYFGDDWYTNSSCINDLGYLICGFTPYDLQKIHPSVFKEINVDVLSKIKRCRVSQREALYKIAVHPDGYGEPYQWTSHEISRLDALLMCIPESEISSIQLEAVAAISQEVMKVIPQDKLGRFTMQQILRMNPKARRIYILRTELKNSLDMSQISQGNTAIVSTNVLNLVYSIVTLLIIC